MPPPRAAEPRLEKAPESEKARPCQSYADAKGRPQIEKLCPLLAGKGTTRLTSLAFAEVARRIGNRAGCTQLSGKHSCAGASTVLLARTVPAADNPRLVLLDRKAAPLPACRRLTGFLPADRPPEELARRARTPPPKKHPSVLLAVLVIPRWRFGVCVSHGRDICRLCPSAQDPASASSLQAHEPKPGARLI